jgi:hypothetical protein
VRSQGRAEELLRSLGALQEIETAILAHCTANHPMPPPYRPQAYKDQLAVFGWLREVRVPPYTADDDQLPINERYDAFKFFGAADREVGVALEMEGWQINDALLKFRRGHHRGQIVAGVLLQPDFFDLDYCFKHKRHLNEPLVGAIPIAFVCPRGPGLREPGETKAPHYGPYLMPHNSGEP